MDGVGEWANHLGGDRTRGDIRLTKEIHFLTPRLPLFRVHLLHRFQVNSAETSDGAGFPMERPGTCRKSTTTWWREPTVVPPQIWISSTIAPADHDQREVLQLFRRSRAPPDEPLTGRHMDLAASVQKVLEEIVLRITALAGRRNRYWEPLPGRRCRV